MSEVYVIFANDWKSSSDFSDEMLIELYNSESYGTSVSQKNGYALGKKWLNLNIEMWKEDIKLGLFRVSELYSDSKFPRWWLDNVFKK